MSPKEQVVIEIPNAQSAAFLAGGEDANLKVIEEELTLSAVVRGNELILTGEKASIELAAKALEGLRSFWEGGTPLNARKIRYALQALREDGQADLRKLFSLTLTQTVKGKSITAKTFRQRSYVEAINRSDVVFGFGPAGTGKTYLAVVMAVLALRDKRVNRIILTRPAVEAGESLGFLPGDLMSKVDPYFRPLYDSLYDLLDAERYQKMLERGIIEVAPIAYMRGRTLNDAFIILDEAQNTTPEQMKMMLTRLGFGSKIVITGDLTQIDLPKGKLSGLAQIESILKGVPGIEFIHFENRDVVRHDLVQRIVNAYETYRPLANAAI